MLTKPTASFADYETVILSSGQGFPHFESLPPSDLHSMGQLAAFDRNGMRYRGV